MAQFTHYPAYDVMGEQDAWDDHTQEIVTARLIRERDIRFFSAEEVEMMRIICSLLIDDVRGDIMQYVLSYIDEKLLDQKGESERKVQVMPEAQLVREVLLRLNAASKRIYELAYTELKAHQQSLYLEDLSFNRANPADIWEGYPQEEGFLKLLSLTLDAYYSHPKVWSDIGYGGPAYPRGYVRTNIGQLDPWEAQSEQ
jgi:hypothetical protein